MVAIILIGIFAFFAFVWYLGYGRTNLFNCTKPDKPYSQQSPVEKVTNTLKARLNKCMEDLANNLRTPEVIENEIITELDNFYASKSTEAKSILTTYRNLIVKCEQSKRLLLGNESLMKMRLNKTKEKYATATESLKPQLVGIASSAMAALKNITKCLTETERRIEEIKNKKQCIEDQIELFVTSFNIKKVEILNHIATIKAMAICDPNFYTNFNINSLIDDLDMAINGRIDDSKVDRMFNAGAAEDITTSVMAVNVDESIKNEAISFLNN